MGRTISFNCDNPPCGAVKKSENHWWKVGRTEGQAWVRPFNPEAAVLPGEAIACGEPCMHQLLHLALTQLTLDLADCQADGCKE